MQRPLKHALIDHEAETSERGWQVAARMPKPKSDSWLSRVIRGSIVPKPEEKEKLAEILGRSVEELFPENQAVEA